MPPGSEQTKLRQPERGENVEMGTTWLSQGQTHKLVKPIRVLDHQQQSTARARYPQSHFRRGLALEHRERKLPD